MLRAQWLRVQCSSRVFDIHPDEHRTILLASSARPCKGIETSDQFVCLGVAVSNKWSSLKHFQSMYPDRALLNELDSGRFLDSRMLGLSFWERYMLLWLLPRFDTTAFPCLFKLILGIPRVWRASDQCRFCMKYQGKRLLFIVGQTCYEVTAQSAEYDLQ